MLDVLMHSLYEIHEIEEKWGSCIHLPMVACLLSMFLLMKMI